MSQTQNEAFLSEIIAHPDDDIPRLIYADWLEEQGDHRSEYIRIQCERAMLDEYDPTQADLRERENRFSEHHLREWSAQIRKYAQRVEFKRGFVEKATVRLADAPDRIPRIQRLTPLRDVKLIQTSKGRMAQFANFEQLLNLRSLNFSGEQLGLKVMHELAASPYLKHIEELDLSNCQLNHPAFSALCRAKTLTSLKRLHLQANRIDGRGLYSLVATGLISTIEELNISSNPFEPEALLAVLCSENVNQLRVLDISDLELNDEVISTLASAHSPKLRELTISPFSLSESTLKRLFKSRLLDQLERLNLYAFHPHTAEETNRTLSLFARLPFTNLKYFTLLSNVGRTTAIAKIYEADWFKNLRNFATTNYANSLDAMLLAECPSFSSQRVLRFDRSINLAGVCALLNSKHAMRLRKLEFQDCGLPDELITHTANSAITNLTSLNLTANAITNEGLGKLQSLEFFNGVQELKLGRVKVGEEGWLELFHSNSFPHLKNLDISDNPLSSNVIDALLNWSRCQQLKTLTVRGADMRAADYARVQAVFGERLAIFV